MHALYHGAHLIEIAVLRRPPRRPHAEPARPRSLRRARLVQHGRDVHQLIGGDTGVVMGALWAIGAVFRAAAGLDRQQGRDLYLARIEVLPVDALGVEDEIGEGEVEQGLHLGARPVVAHGAGEHVGGEGSGTEH